MVTSDLVSKVITESLAAFRQVVAAHRDERFCAFALYSDDDAWTIVPSSNTVEGTERRVAFYKGSVSAAEIAISTPEWAYENQPPTAMQAIGSQLVALTKEVSCCEDSGRHVGAVWATMLIALERNREALTALCKGERTFLLCSVSDSNEALWLEHESSRILNAPEVHDKAFAIWPEEARVELEAQLAKPSFQLLGFRDFLAAHGITT
jgi:hypothetical protein